MNSKSDTSNGKKELPKLTPFQNEIYRGLSRIGEELSAFYLDGVTVYQSENLGMKSYILAHITREIEAGLRAAFYGSKLIK